MLECTLEMRKSCKLWNLCCECYDSGKLPPCGVVANDSASPNKSSIQLMGKIAVGVMTPAEVIRRSGATGLLKCLKLLTDKGNIQIIYVENGKLSWGFFEPPKSEDEQNDSAKATDNTIKAEIWSNNKCEYCTKNDVCNKLEVCDFNGRKLAPLAKR